MGEVIRKDAAASAVLSDLRTALSRARERGAPVQELAEERLAPVLALGDDVVRRLEEAERALVPLVAALAAEDEAADRLLGRTSDEVWNLVGRPAADPAFDLLFPSGIAYYAEGDVAEQPARMDLLAELLEGNIHPRVPAERARALAAEVRDAAARLRARVEAAGPARARAQQLTRIRTAIARSGATQLAALKRLLKAHGLSEAEVHRIIPDRPRAAGRPETPPSA